MAFQEGERVVLKARYPIGDGVYIHQGKTGTVASVKEVPNGPDETTTYVGVQMDEMFYISGVEDNAIRYFTQVVV